VNGAQALINTLVDGGVDVCFANPGTSEMHFVAALDAVPRMRGVLTLFEGVATGAADGYARIARRPAAVLLHLGPGLGNGLANLHNARRARVPMVVVVGDHATYHKKYDAPLESDIESVASSVSGWLRRSVGDVATDAAEAIAASQSGSQVATLILPADISWTEGAQTGQSVPARPAPTVDADAVQVAARVLQSGEPTVILIGGDATRRRHRRPLVLRSIPHPLGARRGRSRGRPDCLLRRGRRGSTRWRQTSDLGRGGIPGVVLRLSGQGERSGARGLPSSCARRTHRRRSGFSGAGR
jgi:thiamine pyrophosphate-dependent acetolactate synthase large subunit-like protein